MKAVISDPPVSAVLFDLDDTLCSEQEYVWSGYLAAARALCGEYPAVFGPAPEPVRDELKTLFRESPKLVFNRILLRHGLGDTEERIGRLVKAYREHEPVLHYHRDVKPTLEGLLARGIRVGILSDGYRVTQERKIAALGAERDFEVIILTDALGRDAWKPSPRGFEAAADRFGLALRDLLYVGDNPAKDFYIAALAPVRTARVIRPDGVYRDTPYHEGVKEQYRLNELTDLLLICGSGEDR